MLYFGFHTEAGEARVVKIEKNGVEELNMRLDELAQGGAGQEWACGRAEPMQLAYAILRDALPCCGEIAEELYRSFRFEVIGNLPRDTFALDQWTVNDWLYRKLDGYRWEPLAA